MSDIKAKRAIGIEKSVEGIITIDIFGAKFRFKPDSKVDQPELIIDDLNHYVEDAEKHIKFTASDRNKLAILLLASMNMSNDLREIKLQYTQLEEHILQKSSSLLEKLEKVSA